MRANDADLLQVPALLAYVSKAVALQTGDVIGAGYPAGNGTVRRRWLQRETRWRSTSRGSATWSTR